VAVAIYSPGVTPTKVRVLEAAVELLGTEGLRSLTHARVDEQAGLPKGSTSNYFRTRAQLLIGVNDWISERDLASADDIATAPHTAADLVEGLAIGIEMLTGPYRIVTAARLTLFMEANHNPEIRAAVSQTRRVMERSIVAVMARLGATDPHSAALALMACGEGIILHRIARHDTTDPRPLLRVVVNAALLD
jgi:AcrR family transcriptional regulator